MLSLPLETLLFDLDGTLRHSIPSADESLFGLSRQLGLSLPARLQVLGTRWAHAYWAQSAELAADLEQFGRATLDFWNQYCYRYLLALAVPAERAADLAPRLYRQFEADFRPQNCLGPAVPETLQALKAQGFTLGLVSNRTRPCQEECEQLGLLGYFDFAYVAAEVEAWKPDPRIFDRALALSGSTPRRTLYLGDNYYADIVGARRAGLQPVLLDPEGVFPEADCTVIRSVDELVGMLA